MLVQPLGPRSCIGFRVMSVGVLGTRVKSRPYIMYIGFRVLSLGG